MKAHSTVAQSILILLLVLPQPIPCQQAVHCRWAPYGEWSECNSCSRTKVRTRHVEVYAQFGGTPCQGQASQVALCESQKGCPLLAGCGERFRCTSGQCISRSLVCNGDQDCEGGLDERGCDPQSRHDACDMDKTPPNSDLTGSGYDVLTGKLRAGVINTRSFGGQCRKVFSGDHSTFYRLPQSILRYNFEVSVDNDESDESYNSSWSYMRHIQENALIGHDRRTFHKELNENKASKLLILKNRVELAQFQNSAAPYLTLAEDFWKALSSLPITYDYPAYRRLLQTYGTHYMSEGSLGGMYQALLEFDRQSLDSTSTTDTEYQRCWRKVKRRLFRKKVKTVCEKLTSSLKSSNGHSSNRLQFKTQLIGGNTAFSGALGVLDVENPELNGEVYARWASSVKDFPDVINQKLRPLSELVKETQCSGLKRLHLQRATEQYLAEEHPCHCRPCRNNGRPLLTGTECTCICRPGTEGKACEQGHAIGEQPGVIHGSWNCWSSWSSCSRGQRSRTRSCTNPSPEMGGLHCPGVAVEHKPCEEPDIRHLQMMEPQCFSLSATPPKTCGLPPNLRNGFVANPKDAYVVGSLVEYSCVGGHYLMGEATARCTDAQTWRTGPMECKRTTCTAPHLSNNVKGAPAKVFYDIGDKVFLSCPGDAALQGYVSQIICNPSLQWSPSPNVAACIQAIPKTTAPPSGLTCKPWEVVGRAQCVCKMPSQCLPSLPLCARIGDGVGEGPGRLLGACQLGALRCLGRGFTLARDTDCVWPKETPPACPHCRAWETCQAGRCECRDPAQCAGGSAFLCVAREGGGAPLRMTECEVGARRCAGENVAVTAIDDC